MPSSGVQTCARSEEHTSELQSHDNLVCRLLLEKNTVWVLRAAELVTAWWCPHGGAQRASSHATHAPPGRARRPSPPPLQLPPVAFFFYMIRPPPSLPLFPYPALSR